MTLELTSFQVLLLMPDGERGINVGREEHIWDAALAMGVRLPALYHQGRCLTCAARLDDGGAVDQSDSASYFPEDREAGLFCCAPENRDRACDSAPINRVKCGPIAASIAYPHPIRDPYHVAGFHPPSFRVSHGRSTLCPIAFAP